MKIYTSYFSNWRNYPEDYNVYSIVAIKQKWTKVNNIPALAPSRELLQQYKNNMITIDKYEEIYRHEQEYVNHDKILEIIGSNIVLVCYEASDDFCHRHILADILNEKGYKTEEL